MRSIVATLSFMASGMLAARFSNVVSVFHLPPGIMPLASPGPALQTGAIVLAAASAANLGLAMIARKVLASSPSATDLRLVAADDAAAPLTSAPAAACKDGTDGSVDRLATVCAAGV